MTNSLHFELWLAWTTLRNDLKCLIAFCQRVLCIEIGFLVIFASHRHSTLTFKQAKPKEELFEVSRHILQFPVWIVWTDIRLHYLCQPFSESKHLKGQLWPRLGDEKCLWRFCLFLPCSGRLSWFFSWFQVGFSWFFMVPGWFFIVPGGFS